jgi:hypothetical protein
MLKDEIILGETGIIEHLLFGGERKAKQLEKILQAFDRHVKEFQDSFKPTMGLWRSTP